MDKHTRPYTCEEEGCENRGFTYSGGLHRHQREVHNQHGGPKARCMCPIRTASEVPVKGFHAARTCKNTSAASTEMSLPPRPRQRRRLLFASLKSQLLLRPFILVPKLAAARGNYERSTMMLVIMMTTTTWIIIMISTLGPKVPSRAIRRLCGRKSRN